MTKERFEKLWEQAAASAHSDGNLSIADWSEMCAEMERQNIAEMPGEGHTFADPRHLAFLAGVQWGFKRGIISANVRDQGSAPCTNAANQKDNQMKTDDTNTKSAAGADSLDQPVRNVRCATTMSGDRSIECESGPDYFCFEFRTGKHTQRLKITNEAAWIVREMLDAMHPNICGSSNPLWHKAQAMRKGSTIPNVRSEVSPPATGASESTTNRRQGGD